MTVSDSSHVWRIGKKALSTADGRVRRYLDDSSVVAKRGRVDTVLQLFNRDHDSIQYMSEKEEDGRISFLDIELQKENGGIRTNVFKERDGH